MRITTTEVARQYLQEHDQTVVRFDGNDVIVSRVCSRCGGHGEYSFNPLDGTKCFGCRARGRPPKWEERHNAKKYAQKHRANARARDRRDERRIQEARGREAERLEKLEEQRAANEAAGLGRLTHLEVEQAKERAARKAEEERIQQERDRSRHLGTVGEKLTVEATVKTRRGIDTAWGYSTLIIFETDDGQLVKWFGSGEAIFKLDEGQRVRVTGRVKAHDYYDGYCQTQITRAKYEVLRDLPELSWYIWRDNVLNIHNDECHAGWEIVALSRTVAETVYEARQESRHNPDHVMTFGVRGSGVLFQLKSAEIRHAEDILRVLPAAAFQEAS